MEGLRYSLMAPSAGSVVMVFGVVAAMSEMVKVRDSAKDEATGKFILPHPYAPWQPVDAKYQDKADAAYRAFKMFENVKEWTFLSLPLMWIFFLYGGTLPYVTDQVMDAVILGSTGLYFYGTVKFITGYIEAAEKRMTGFNIRRKVCEFWLLGSAASLLWAAAQRFGLTFGL